MISHKGDKHAENLICASLCPENFTNRDLVPAISFNLTVKLWGRYDCWSLY